MSRIEDVLYADTVARETPKEQSIENHSEKIETDKLSSNDTEDPKTLSEFMGWEVDKGNFYTRSTAIKESCCKEEEDNINLMSKPGRVLTPKKISYLEKLENLSALRSPTARH